MFTKVSQVLKVNTLVPKVAKVVMKKVPDDVEVFAKVVPIFTKVTQVLS